MIDNSSTPADPKSRKPYAAPRVKHYGNIKDITQNLKPCGHADTGVGLKTAAA
jgi:hypothetical protein